ncbi:class I SAM-dependent methyltransferase [Streptomyces sp. wa22]|nr:class I SAM-dependent methyltransferase [Streptomyces sp. wa22]
MVEQLRTKADWEATPVVLGDMATATAPGAGRFRLVCLVLNAISVLQTQPEQVECFRNAARHLAPGGRFVIELWVPEVHKLPPDRKAVMFRSGTGHISSDTCDVLNQQVVSHHLTRPSGAGPTARWISRSSSRTG